MYTNELLWYKTTAIKTTNGILPIILVALHLAQALSVNKYLISTHCGSGSCQLPLLISFLGLGSKGAVAAREFHRIPLHLVRATSLQNRSYSLVKEPCIFQAAKSTSKRHCKSFSELDFLALSQKQSLERFGAWTAGCVQSWEVQIESFLESLHSWKIVIKKYP